MGQVSRDRRDPPSPDTLRYLLIVRTAVFGRWLACVGVAAAAILIAASATLAGVYVIPVIDIWAAATSVAMWRAA